MTTAKRPDGYIGPLQLQLLNVLWDVEERQEIQENEKAAANKTYVPQPPRRVCSEVTLKSILERLNANRQRPVSYAVAWRIFKRMEKHGLVEIINRERPPPKDARFDWEDTRGESWRTIRYFLPRLTRSQAFVRAVALVMSEFEYLLPQDASPGGSFIHLVHRLCTINRTTEARKLLNLIEGYFREHRSSIERGSISAIMEHTPSEVARVDKMATCET